MPACSIVIPVFNHASVTRQCLNALLADPPRDVDCEIVVVDDASTDITPELLASYGSRIRSIRHQQNRGFATTCNDGAAAASGDLLLFLNNDILPRPGWLDALVRYARAHPAAAAIGSKLLYPDGTIQHAGVTICRSDRYPRHLYRGFPGEHPAVNRSRPLQIVTAASLLVRRAAFRQAGGFDTAFINGFEDVDFCLRLGELGHEVHYCHESVLVHFESASRGGRAHEATHNNALYRQRWADRVRPDDIEIYIADGLIGFGYPKNDLYPLRCRLDPELALLDAAHREDAADRLLLGRARQVWQLTSENVQLRLELQELRDRLGADAPPRRAALNDADD
jgi:GT2 family glycosyltransferase